MFWQCVSMSGFSESVLLNPVLAERLEELLPSLPKRLLFRASKSGFSAGKFYEFCVLKGPTVVVVKAKHSDAIFGGFAAPAWPKPPHVAEVCDAFSVIEFQFRFRKHRNHTFTAPFSFHVL